MECQDRAERRAIRDRVSLERQEAIRDIMIKGDLSTWLDHRLKELEKVIHKVYHKELRTFAEDKHSF